MTTPHTTTYTYDIVIIPTPSIHHKIDRKDDDTIHSLTQYYMPACKEGRKVHRNTDQTTVREYIQCVLTYGRPTIHDRIERK